MLRVYCLVVSTTFPGFEFSNKDACIDALAKKNLSKFGDFISVYVIIDLLIYIQILQTIIFKKPSNRQNQIHILPVYLDSLYKKKNSGW